MADYLTDAGVNLTSSQLYPIAEQVVARATAENVQRMLLIGCDISSSEQALSLAQQFQFVSTAGVHPHDAKGADDNLEQQLTTLAAQPQVVAIGECGLDYNRDFSPREVQRSVFRRQLALAEQLSLPVYLHERDASEDMLAILADYQVKGVLHCFTGSQASLEKYLEYGLYIGVTGWVCDERRGEELQKCVPQIPLSRLLIETDAPYLLPRTIKPKPKSRRNEPCYLPYVAAKVAQLKQCQLADIVKQTTLNFQTLFAIEA